MHRLFALALLASCAPPTYAFTPASSRGVVPKPDNCTVEVLTSPPTKDYDSVGELDFYDGDKPKSLDVFEKAVAKQVCQAGGDAVIAIADDHGRYTKGQIIEYLHEPSGVNPGPAPETPPPAK